MNTSTCIASEPSFLERVWWRIKAFLEPKRESNIITHAKREFKAVGYMPLDQEQEDGPNKWIQENVLELLAVFEKQGHSGFSAHFCIDMFSKLAAFKPLAPLYGTDDEWNDVSDISGSPTWQNKRCSHVFKDADGRAYDINGRVFREPSGCCYTSRDSRVYVTFPYTPKTEYVDVDA